MFIHTSILKCTQSIRFGACLTGPVLEGQGLIDYLVDRLSVGLWSQCQNLMKFNHFLNSTEINERLK